jgi:hypothetical protein
MRISTTRSNVNAQAAPIESLSPISTSTQMASVGPQAAGARRQPEPGLQPPQPTTAKRLNASVDAAIPSLPKQTRPILTRQSLAAWVRAEGLSVLESAHRKKARQLILKSCTASADPTEELRLQGNLKLFDCTALTQLPEGLRVQGNLELFGCAILTQLPEGLHVQGRLALYACTALTCLPEGLHVQGDLKLRNCTALTHLPEGFSLQGSLELFGCTALTHLPEGLSMQGRLDLFGCTALTHLPEGLSAPDNTILYGCTALTHLPAGFSVQGTLNLVNCTALTHLPEGFCVQGTVNLNGCTALTHLPEGFYVQGDLTLVGCTALTHLPAGLYVQGNLNLNGCTALTALPQSILHWERPSSDNPRAIYLQDTAISPQTRHQLEQALGQQEVGQRGIRLYFFDSEATSLTPFTNLQQAWDFWQHEASDSSMAAGSQPPTGDLPAHPFMHLDEDGQNTLMRYFGGLRGTAEYTSRATRPVLATRVTNLAESLRDLHAAEAALRVLEVAMSSCEDRHIIGLDQAEQGLRVYSALETGDLKKLSALGIEELKLQVVREHAEAKVKSLLEADPSAHVDEVEVHLFYQIRLADELGLPVATRTMRYSAPVTEGDLRKAAIAAAAAAANPLECDKFLNAWPPWQNAQRAMEAKKLRYDAIVFMPPEAEHLQSDCFITRESFSELIEPVTAEHKTWVAELSELMTWWAKEGTDPTNRVDLALTDLRRLREQEGDGLK